MIIRNDHPDDVHDYGWISRDSEINGRMRQMLQAKYYTNDYGPTKDYRSMRGNCWYYNWVDKLEDILCDFKDDLGSDWIDRLGEKAKTDKKYLDVYQKVVKVVAEIKKMDDKYNLFGHFFTITLFRRTSPIYGFAPVMGQKDFEKLIDLLVEYRHLLYKTLELSGGTREIVANYSQQGLSPIFALPANKSLIEVNKRPTFFFWKMVNIRADYFWRYKHGK